MSFSALLRAEIVEINTGAAAAVMGKEVSVLFYEPKLLKSDLSPPYPTKIIGFSALLRAEIVEIQQYGRIRMKLSRFSALLRAEIVEMFV